MILETAKLALTPEQELSLISQQGMRTVQQYHRLLANITLHLKVATQFRILANALDTTLAMVEESLNTTPDSREKLELWSKYALTTTLLAKSQLSQKKNKALLDKQLKLTREMRSLMKLPQ